MTNKAFALLSISFLLLALLAMNTCFSQRPKLDNLTKENNKHTAHDEKKLELLNQIANLYSWVQIDTGIIYADHAIALADKPGNKKQLATAYNNKALLLYHLVQFKEDEQLLQKAIEINKAIANTDGLADNYLNLSQLKKGDESKKLIDDALSLFTKTNNEEGIARASINEGIYFVERDSRAALNYYNKALDLFNKHNNKVWVTSAYRSIAGAYMFLARYDSQLYYGNTALKMALSEGNNLVASSAYATIGNFYYIQTDYQKIIENYLKGLRISEAMNSKFSQATFLNNLGSMYIGLNNYEKALYYLNKGKEISVGDNLIFALTCIGSIFLDQEKYNEAESNYKQAINLCIETKNTLRLPMCYATLAKIAFLKNDCDSSFSYLKETVQTNYLDKSSFARLLYYGIYAKTIKKSSDALLIKWGINPASRHKLIFENTRRAIALAKELEDKPEEYEEYLELSAAYEAVGNTDSAFFYYKKHSALKDTVLNADNLKATTNLQLEYETEKKEQQIVLLNKDNALQIEEIKRQKVIRNGVVTGLTVVCAFLLLVFIQRNKIRKEKKRSDALLLNILPSEVADELKAKGSADARQFEQVTIMFTDFKGFTLISEKLSPHELVAEIDYYFKAFDEIITRHNIEKIKTIGDSYMCAGGLPVENKTNAHDVVQAAIEIQQFILADLQQRKRQNKEPFEIRIGIHTGTVVAGIVGIKKFAYDIWGDAVNIASRMESSGDAGKVNISGATYQLVKNKFNCIYRGKIQAKNKGEIDMYFVEGVS